jgi:hypothetical protein
VEELYEIIVHAQWRNHITLFFMQYDNTCLYININKIAADSGLVNYLHLIIVYVLR